MSKLTSESESRADKAQSLYRSLRAEGCTHLEALERAGFKLTDSEYAELRKQVAP